MPDPGSFAEILARKGLLCAALGLCAWETDAFAQQPAPDGGADAGAPEGGAAPTPPRPLELTRGVVTNPSPKAAIQVPYPEGATGEQTGWHGVARSLTGTVVFIHQ